MKIENVTATGVYFDNLNSGDVFLFKGDLFIKCMDLQSIRLKDGYIASIMPSTEVILYPEAKVVLGKPYLAERK